ncbi:MAG: N-acetylmuramic acid 6-phosphate etherase [Coriobacteriales bacterium]|nr:N-acetylmuramic acid 6-phosphate etherase [Coriobacteriales bacterium]
MDSLSKLSTEQRNERSLQLDQMSALEIVQTMNREDEQVAHAVREVLPQVAQAVELAAASLKRGGRLIYLGAGTSGRLGLLDAVECPPTFGTSPDTVVGLMAGGDRAFVKAVEGAEDKPDLCQAQLQALDLTKDDLVVGIAASGRTPYVLGGLAYARTLGCATVALACVRNSAIGQAADVAIEPVCGPEVLSGSTRLKAGTAQKMVLNMISTGAMVRIGKVYQNLMVDVQQTNEKLRLRARHIVCEACACSAERAEKSLREAQGNVKVAILMVARSLTREEAVEALDAAGGNVRAALDATAKDVRHER